MKPNKRNTCLFILLVLTSMGFTTFSIAEPHRGRKERIEKPQRARGGYLEVVSPASYSLTVAGR